MLKKRLRIWAFIIVAVICIFLCGDLRAFASDDFEISDGVLIGYHGDLTTVNIPDSVTTISRTAFYQNESIKNVIIPNSAHTIGDEAFEGCMALESVIIPETTNNIGIDVFSECDNVIISCYENSFAHTYALLYGLDFILLDINTDDDCLISDGVLIKYMGTDINVLLPSSITSIGPNAFSGCDFIQSITFQSDIVSIGAFAFSGCTALKTVSVFNDVDTIGAYAFHACEYLSEITLLGDYTIIPEGLFESCSNLAIINLNETYQSIGKEAFKNCISLSAIDIPESTSGIEEKAFMGCNALLSVSLPNHITTLGDGVFSLCKNLNAILLSDGLKTTGDATFSGCINLSSIVIPEGIEEIGMQCFENCSTLTSVNLPDSLTRISSEAFSGSNLTHIDFAKNISVIGDYAFMNCNLESILIPRQVKQFGIDIFNGCDNIIVSCYIYSYAHQYAHINGLTYTLIDDGLGNPFFIEDHVLVMYFGFDKTVEIPSHVITIGAGAFKQNLDVETVIIPNGVTNISEEAFYACRNLKDVSLPDSVEHIGDNAFLDCINLLALSIKNRYCGLGDDVFAGCQMLSVSCCFGSTMDDYGALYQIPIIYLPDNMPIEHVVMCDLPEKMLCPEDGVVISAQAFKHGQLINNASFRLSYRKEDDPWWTYLSAEFIDCEKNGDITFKFIPEEEGEYYFKLEAKATGNENTEVVVVSDKTAIYFHKFPVKAITKFSIDKPCYLYTESIGIDLELYKPENEDQVEYQLLYSINGDDWLTLDGKETFLWLELDDNDAAHIDLDLPVRNDERMHQIKLNIRTAGRDGVDQSAAATVDMYHIMPLESVKIDNLDDVVVCPKEGIKISAAAKAMSGYDNNAYYKFYYSKNGGESFKAFTGWTLLNTAYFKTTKEGTYLFKVEAKSIGRKSLDVFDKTDIQTNVYIGAVPASGLKIETEKSKYYYGEKIKLFLSVTPGGLDQQTQYLIQYSANGKSFKTIPGTKWMDYPDDLMIIGDTRYAEVLIPSQKIGKPYDIKVLIRTVGRKGNDLEAETTIDLDIDQPIAGVDLLDIANPVVQTSQGIILEARAAMEDGSEPHAEYRFLYKKSQSAKWTYISSKFSYQNRIEFFMKAEGNYSFKVEAKTAGQAEIGGDDIIENIDVFHEGIPTKGISINLKQEKNRFLIDDAIGINTDVSFYDDEADHDVSFEVMVSTNGKSFKVLDGYGYHEYDGESDIVLPYSKKDITHYIKVNVKTAGRMTTDAVSNIIEVKRYHVMPIDEVRLSCDKSGDILIGDESVMLFASAYLNDELYDAEYRFLYKAESSKKWEYISSSFSEACSTIFPLEEEGIYDVKVEARAKGRSTVDDDALLSDPVKLYENNLPAESVCITPLTK